MTPEVQKWLTEAGYMFQCFVSWPHTTNPEIADCARHVKLAVERELAYSVANPNIFFDETGIIGGDAWEERLRSALCRSVAMVALCAPIYYHPDHAWCGREWAAMEVLGAQRLAGLPFRAIIPILLRERHLLPRPVAKVQYIDFSRVALQGRRFYSTNEFRAKIAEVVGRIEEVAQAIVRSQARADCDGFRIPEASAFAGTEVPPQRFPFRGGH